MTNATKLQNKITQSGLKLSFIAEQLGITRFSLSKKLEGITEFKTSEIKKICLVLHITSEEIPSIFFEEKDESNSTL